MPVKYRKALIDKRIERVMIETARGIGERYEIELEALGMDKDHVHLLCGAHPKIAPGSIVMKFKSITARELFKRERWLKEELWGGRFWSSGYYVGTVGERGNWAMVEKYVLEQGKAEGGSASVNTVVENKFSLPDTPTLASGRFIQLLRNGRAARRGDHGFSGSRSDGCRRESRVYARGEDQRLQSRWPWLMQ